MTALVYVAIGSCDGFNGVRKLGLIGMGELMVADENAQLLEKLREIAHGAWIWCPEV